jgi:CRISPR/Cas system-associated exonuclease Cas4 (RecB family)
MIDAEKIIGDQLLKENESHSRARQVGEYYCTDLGTCIRKTWYKYQDIELEEQDREEEVRMLKVFERGNLLHEWITNRLRMHVEEIGGTLREEVSIVMPDLKNNFVIRGRIDNLIAKDNAYEIIEVKTTARIPSPKGRKIMPMPHHVAQVMPYLLFSPSAKAGILYIEPNTLKTAFYEVNRDVFLMQELWAKANDLHQSLLNNVLPHAEAKLKKSEEWQCKYCEFSSVCEKQELGSIPLEYVSVETKESDKSEVTEENVQEKALEHFAKEAKELEEILHVGNDIVDQHSTPQGWLEENDPIAVQEPKSSKKSKKD